MRSVCWQVAPVALTILCGVAVAADAVGPKPVASPGKVNDPITISANKKRLLNSKPTLPSGPSNVPPPVGAILDLNGTPIPGHGNSTYQQYTVNFVANVANTAITFAFREDPAFLLLENVSVVDVTTSSANLLTNGDFSGGTYTNNGNSATPNGWTYANIYGASAGGVVRNGCGGPQAGGICWYDGAVQAYDAISQSIPTTIGHTYQISFFLADNSGQATFSRLSTNGDVTDTGGNGIDLLVYAQAGLPSAGGNNNNSVPTLSEWGMLLMALMLGTAGWVQVRRTLHAR